MSYYEKQLYHTPIVVDLSLFFVMEVSSIMEKDWTLNIFEHRSAWSRLAINLAFCFHLPRATNVAEINDKLQDALDALTSNFP